MLRTKIIPMGSCSFSYEGLLKQRNYLLFSRVNVREGGFDYLKRVRGAVARCAMALVLAKQERLLVLLAKQEEG